MYFRLKEKGVYKAPISAGFGNFSKNPTSEKPKSNSKDIVKREKLEKSYKTLSILA